MVRRSQRYISPETTERLLKTIRDCRAACCQLSAQAPINGREYNAADALRTALDDMTGVLTGDRERFWVKVHSTHQNSQKICDDKAS